MHKIRVSSYLAQLSVSLLKLVAGFYNIYNVNIDYLQPFHSVACDFKIFMGLCEKLSNTTSQVFKKETYISHI